MLLCKKQTLILFFLLFPFAISGKTGKEIIKENGFKSYVDPLIKTKWAQYGGGENAYLPYINDPDRESVQAKTGCGATALAQIMKFWNHPKQGMGVNSYHWVHPNTDEMFSRYVDFSESYYDWNNMIEKYFENESRTQKQIDAVAKLMYDIGIALEMQYKDWSTATQIEYISTVMKKNFGYNPYLRVVRFVPGGYTMDEWLTIIYRELSEGRPILMGANNYSGDRHIFVADGYDKDGKVHFNLGHANDKENKYYDLISPGKDDNDWLYNMRMIIGIYPQEKYADTDLVHVATAGTILNAMGGEKKAKKICRLKVTGKLNKEDIYVLRRLCRADIGQEDLSDIGQLSYLDLSEASIEDDELPDNAFWYKIDSDEEIRCFTLQTIKLPSNLKRIGHNAFRSCFGLYEVTIPSTLTTIGNMSFFACRYLDSIILPKTVKKIGKDAFGRTKVDNLEIDANNTYYYVDNNGIITADGKKIIAYTGKKKGGYEIPDGVEKIDGTYVFSLKSNLTSLTFPTSMNSISTYFDYCPGITDLFSYMTEKWCQATLMDWIKYNRIVLHVPIGYKEKYEDAYKQAYDNEWRGMGTVVEDLDPTLVDVEELLNQFAPENHCVYDLNGRRIPIHLRQNKQIYIINGRKVIN